VDNNTYFHLAAFRGNVVNGTTNTAIAGVADPQLAKSPTGGFFAPPGGRIYAALAGGVNASRARINTAKCREVGLPYIAPLNTGVTIPSPPNMAVYGDNGVTPNPTDELIVESTHTDVAAQIQYAAMILKFGFKQQAAGQEYRLRFTSTITGVIGSWASGAITFDQQVPAGTYQIVGLDVFGTNLLLARLLFIGGGWRPGVPARNAVNSVPHPLALSGVLGPYGEFSNTAIPQLEIYCEAANAAQEGYIDVIRIG
jgi:hypothetical protein